MNPLDKQKAYAADITYGTNNEFGFDYLRDNMVVYKNQLVQRKLNYAIVDDGADRDSIEPKHFKAWLDFAKKNNVGIL